MLTSSYIGFAALASGKVKQSNSAQGKAVIILGEIIEQVPIVGVAGTIIKGIAGIIDMKSGKIIAHKVLEVFSSNENLEVISEELAIRLTNARYVTLITLDKSSPQNTITKYKDKIAYWMKGEEISNLSEI